MSIFRVVVIGACTLFAIIAVVGLVKKVSQPKAVAQPAAIVQTAPAPVVQQKPVESAPQPKAAKTVAVESLQEIPLPQKPIPQKATPIKPTPVKATPVKATPLPAAPVAPALPQTKSSEKQALPPSLTDLPTIDRIHQLFTTFGTKLPIVETVTYASSVPWIKGRPAWIADYASYYQTSRHFIARSLNGKPDYFTQRVSTGNRFNVFCKDKNIHFYLLIDVSHCKMGFYYFDLDTQERVLLKTYHVGLGRPEPGKPSGTLTPLGTFSLGGKVAIYKPGTTGQIQNRTIEMVRVFGTRWIPFDQEVEGCTAPAKGYGIHGAPWIEDSKGGALVENRASIGKYESDGCIRLTLEDMEELFAIVLTKPTFAVIVKELSAAKLPGTEVATPTR